MHDLDDDLDEQRNAYHESGHAFLALYVGARVRSVTIQPDRDDGPARHADTQIVWPVDPLDPQAPKTWAQRAVLVALAGPVAEMLQDGSPYHPGFVAEWAGDWQIAWKAAARLHPSERRRLEYLEQTTLQLRQLLDEPDHWAALAAIADHLLAHDTLDGDEVEEIVRAWID